MSSTMKTLRNLFLLLPLLAVVGCKTYKAQPDLVDIRQFKPAAERGDAWAQFRLGQAYASRWKFSEANPWYRKAALQGVPDAMHALGVNCLSGAGVPKDPIAAYAWFDVAATQTHILAANARQNLADRMSRTEIEEGDRMASDIVAQIPPMKLRYAFVPKISSQAEATGRPPASAPMKKDAPAAASPAKPAKPSKPSAPATKPAKTTETSAPAKSSKAATPALKPANKTDEKAEELKPKG